MKKSFKLFVCVLFLPYSMVQPYFAPKCMRSKGFIGSALVSGGVLSAVSWLAYRRMKQAETKKEREKYARMYKICGAIAAGALGVGAFGAFSQKPTSGSQTGASSQKPGQAAVVVPLAPGQIDSYLSMSDSVLYNAILDDGFSGEDPVSLVLKSGNDEAGEKLIKKLFADPKSQCASMFNSGFKGLLGSAFVSMPKTAIAVRDGLVKLKGSDAAFDDLNNSSLLYEARTPAEIYFLLDTIGLDVNKVSCSVKWHDREHVDFDKTLLHDRLINNDFRGIYRWSKHEDCMAEALILKGASLGPVPILKYIDFEYKVIGEVGLLLHLVQTARPEALSALCHMGGIIINLGTWTDTQGKNLLSYCQYKDASGFGLAQPYLFEKEPQADRKFNYKEYNLELDKVVQILIDAGVDSTAPAVQEAAKKAPEGSALRRLVQSI